MELFAQLLYVPVLFFTYPIQYSIEILPLKVGAVHWRRYLLPIMSLSKSVPVKRVMSDAVTEYQTTEKTLAEVAAEFGVSTSALHRAYTRRMEGGQAEVDHLVCTLMILQSCSEL